MVQLSLKLPLSYPCKKLQTTDSSGSVKQTIRLEIYKMYTESKLMFYFEHRVVSMLLHINITSRLFRKNTPDNIGTSQIKLNCFS
ncbi:unnamed protein product [Ceutorhynchus assimilis]|uniref:Uncharacterized protein n=1 Tax=Ceutorhynchus assimilis TaxID=467358 RepID=A0A9N9QR71_9CUCU|nr:unnamed protein product [Ceutorhynchus assimilis]